MLSTADIVSVAMESTRCSSREERAQRRALKRDNRGGNAVANMEEGARGGDVEEVREAAGGGGRRAQRRRGGQASVRGRGVGDDQDDVEVLQVAVAPGDQDVEEMRDEAEGEDHEVLEDIDAADLEVREVIDLEEGDVVDVEVMVAQVEEEVDDQEAVRVVEEIMFEDAVGQIGDGQDDEEERLEEQDDQSTEEQVEVAEADLEDGPALSDTIDLTDSPRPNRCAKTFCLLYW